jgi:mRNA interferase MazF
MRRGEIWWANLNPPAGRRPLLLLSRNSAYDIRTSITVALITRTIRDIPVEVMLDIEDGMVSKCVVNLDEIVTIRKSSLLKYITTLSPEKMLAINQAVIFALDL